MSRRTPRRPAAPVPAPRPRAGLLTLAFFTAVAAFGWWRFSDNTADNDLWGHVLYGQRMLALGHVERTDPFSWTVPDAPWINHEVLAEVALGAVHRAAGGTGLWVLSWVAALLTLALALRAGRRDACPPGLGLVQATLLAASINGIALGFSVRPQLFTLFALVLWLDQMRALGRGARAALVFLPVIALIWINTHGGVLAGLLLLLLATAVTALLAGFPAIAFRGFFRPAVPGAALRFFGALLLSSAAALVTPWGPESLRWLVASVGFTRPEITEWRPTPLDFPHAAFWIVVGASLVAWSVSRRGRHAWEAAVLAVLLAMAWRHQRHIPLFLLANLILTPVHLFDLLQRADARTATLRATLRSVVGRWAAAGTLMAAAVACVVASFGPPKENPWTIEVERSLFPCAALNFLRDHPIPGNLLVFFDWGQQAMWELPDNRVSFDGRFDTVYPRPVIDAHWKFYRGEQPDPAVLDVRGADVALLPTAAGAGDLLRRQGWTLAYVDPLASVWIRDLAANDALRGLTLPVRVNRIAVTGREDFPEEPSLWADRVRAR